MENERGKNTKRRHLNKNKKKSWRKVNIESVEEFLEDERLQERTGGQVAEKPDSSLFFVDTLSTDPAKVLEGRKERKRKAQDKLKEIEEGLNPPPPKKKDKRAAVVIEKETSGRLSYTQRLAAKNRQLANKQRTEKRERGRSVPDFDLWGDTLEREHEGEDPHYLKVTRKTRARVPKHHQDPVTKVPAIEVPHPGASYNPAYDDHQELLRNANDVEVKKLQEEERIRRALDAKFPSADEAPTEATRLAEMSAGLFDDDNDNDNADIGDLDKLSVNPPVNRDSKKDERRRKKEKRRKQEAKKLQREKLKKLKDNEFFRLKTIKAEINKEEQVQAVRAVKKAQQKAGQPYRTKKLGKLKYEEPSKEIKLSTELVGSLREIKPEGHLLADRYKSLQKRNIIEPRERAKKQRKYKPKIYEKRSHRAITT